MRKIVLRIIVGVLFALPFWMVTTFWVQASDQVDIEGSGDLDCYTCHPAFYNSWEQSSHGISMTDPSFKNAWNEQGNEPECLTCHTTGYDPVTNEWVADGVACEACHGPIQEEHPQHPMPSDRSANLCGTCHQETLFEWQVSKHRETNLTCVDCHGQHSTTLRSEDASALCANCHRERASNFAHTEHSQEGLSCSDCHLGPTSGEKGEGHAAKDHSFHVQLSTCNECHGYQMHDPTDVHTDDHVGMEIDNEEPIDAMASVEAAGVSLDPDPVSPIYYALLSALLGMAFGLLVSPWIERWYRRTRIDASQIDIDTKE